MSSTLDAPRSSAPMTGQVIGIFVAKKRGEPMVRIEEARAHAGKGLEGDRYYDGAGTFSAKVSPSHEVSLLEIEALEALKRDLKVDLPPILSRRNIMTRGVALNHLINREFTVGEVTLRGIELCEPCGHMEKLSGQKGARNGLVHRGGLRCQILKGGPIRTGDTITVWDTNAAGSELGAGASGQEQAAGSVLGPAGDVSPELATVEGMEFSLIPPGQFVLGSDQDPLAWDGESPQQVTDLPYTYWMARFPVSHAQYRQFVDDRGYRQADLWPEATEALVWKDGLLETKVSDTPLYTSPDIGDPFNRPAHPVGAVGWYEALAFTRWLDRRWHAVGILGPEWTVRLPNELEWEKAARGGLEYPTTPTWSRADALGSKSPAQLEKIRCRSGAIPGAMSRTRTGPTPSKAASVPPVRLDVSRMGRVPMALKNSAATSGSGRGVCGSRSPILRPKPSAKSAKNPAPTSSARSRAARSTTANPSFDARPVTATVP